MNRRYIFLASGIGIALLVAAIAAGTVVLLRRSAQPAATVTQGESGSLPAAEQIKEVQLANPTSSSTDVTTPPTETQVTSEPQTRLGDELTSPTHLAVTVVYSRNTSHSLSIQTVGYAKREPNAEDFEETIDNGLYSTVKVYNVNNHLLGEYRFSIATSVIGENFSDEGAQPVVQLLDKNPDYLILPIQPNQNPTRVDLVSSAGELIDTHTIPAQPLSNIPTNFFYRLARAVSRLIGNQSFAQTDPCGGNHFFIVVTNDWAPSSDPDHHVTETKLKSMVDKAFEETEKMLKELPPWPDYASCIIAYFKYNLDTPLDCDPDPIFPSCANEQQVHDYTGAGADATIVVVPWITGFSVSATVEPWKSVVALNPHSGIKHLIIGHELGHAVGQMTDEYGGGFGFAHPPGPNCFVDASECTIAGVDRDVQDAPGFECKRGCNDAYSYRPSSKLMYKPVVADYGPLETCIMRDHISASIRSGNPEDDSTLCSSGGPFGDITVPAS